MNATDGFLAIRVDDEGRVKLGWASREADAHRLAQAMSGDGTVQLAVVPCRGYADWTPATPPAAEPDAVEAIETS